MKLTEPTRLPDLLSGTTDASTGKNVEQSGPGDDDWDALDPEGYLPTSAEIAEAASGLEDLSGDHDASADGVALPSLNVDDLFGMGEKFVASVDDEAHRRGHR